MQGQDQQGRVTRVRATGEGRANPEPPARSAGQMELLVVGGWRLAGSRGEPAPGPGCQGQPGLQSGVQAAVLRWALASEGEALWGLA